MSLTCLINLLFVKSVFPHAHQFVKPWNSFSFSIGVAFFVSDSINLLFIEFGRVSLYALNCFGVPGPVYSPTSFPFQNTFHVSPIFL
jgi:hypothetical protein